MRVRKSINIENSEEAIYIAKIAAALAHPVRVALFSYVKSKNEVRNDVCNKDLVAHFNYSQSSLSQHVKKLLEAELFEVTYEHKFSNYSINKKTVDRFTKLLKAI